MEAGEGFGSREQPPGEESKSRKLTGAEWYYLPLILRLLRAIAEKILIQDNDSCTRTPKNESKEHMYAVRWERFPENNWIYCFLSRGSSTIRNTDFIFNLHTCCCCIRADILPCVTARPDVRLDHRPQSGRRVPSVNLIATKSFLRTVKYEPR